MFTCSGSIKCGSRRVESEKVNKVVGGVKFSSADTYMFEELFVLVERFISGLILINTVSFELK